MKKTTIILITVLFMVIGYAAYNTTINIYGNGKLAENLSDFKVYLSNLKVNGKEVSGINNTKDKFTINDINGDISVDIVNDSTEYDTESYLECSVDNTWDYDYTGGEQTFTAPTTGTYKLETWGASGGDAIIYKGGYGGYSTGKINLSSNEILYINVGGHGNIEKIVDNGYLSGGYNGGGGSNVTGSISLPDKYQIGSGGGATHIATTSGVLSKLEAQTNHILIVSGGGGGAMHYYNSDLYYSYGAGGHGGGFNGTSTYDANYWYYGNENVVGGTQEPPKNLTSHQQAGSFGQGFDNVTEPKGYIGGGGGYYGGNSQYSVAGSGGSGYIGNSLLTEKTMYCYNCAESNETSTKTISTTCVNATPIENCAKQGNGYARITLLSSPTSITTDKVTITAQESSNQNIENIVGKSLTCKLKVNKISKTEKKVYNGPTEWTFDYTGGEQTFIAPTSGTYKLEVWGAQGGNIGNYTGGYGAYSIGSLSIIKRQELYINVGGSGSQTDTGGYNGGGNLTTNQYKYAASGGGATHIATLSGILANLENQKDNILMVAGGGGGANFRGDGCGEGNGGSGGGIHGVDGTSVNHTGNYWGWGYGTGGTQTNGGKLFWNDGVNHEEGADGVFGSAGVVNSNIVQGGAGGGFYGGGSGAHGAAGGGSGYIGNSLLTEKSMYCYNCQESSEESTKTISTTCTNATPTANCAKSGNGYARITLISTD